MPDSTLAVRESTIHTLNELAGQTGKCVQDVLEQALDDFRRKLFLEGVNAAYAAVRSDPQEWAAVEEERRSMSGSLIDGLDPQERWGKEGDLLPEGEGNKDG